jgi:hypothetical protein
MAGSQGQLGRPAAVEEHQVSVPRAMLRFGVGLSALWGVVVDAAESVEWP